MPDIALPHLEGISYYYSPDGRNGTHWEPLDETDYRRQAVIDDISSVRTEVDAIPHDETRLNIARMSGYLQRYGLVMGPFIGLDEAGKLALQTAYRCKSSDSLMVASHSSLVDVTYALRSASEQAQGKELTEATLIHEETHRNGRRKDIVVYQNDKYIGYHLSKDGYVREIGGQLLGKYHSEGIAQLMYHGYITEALNRPNGLLDIAEPQPVRSADKAHFNFNYLLPGSYLYAGAKPGSENTHVSSHAAYGMQLLIAQDPTLFSVMLQGLYDDEAQQEYVERLDDLIPGLHSLLDKLPYRWESFAWATNSIIKHLYAGDAVKALETVSQPAAIEIAAA